MTSSGRFKLVTAAHHFLMTALPLREPDSRVALETFSAAAERLALPEADVDAVLLRCLAVIDSREGPRIPSLVERYLLNALTPEHPTRHFSACVGALLRHRCVRDGAVQQAIEVVRARFADPTLDARALAQAVDVRLATLDVAFRRCLGCSVTEHLRSVRLERAAALLTTTGMSIKEIWADVGYNHHSNFDHDFKRQYGMSPSLLRARSIQPFARAQYRAVETRPETTKTASGGTRVLLVDDDAVSRSAVSACLRDRGYSVSLADNGAEGLGQAFQHAPHAILLEYRLPDMDGLHFLRRLRDERPGGRPVATIFTADWDVLSRASEFHGLHATIASKLCDTDHLAEMVGSLIYLSDADGRP